ncbi:hypothetical protein ACFO0A_02170 [Novosphingobium tardum]|uniref:Secreted protein n=1 Tax=Novosphingobium tardum TaxID=1538021 RepID=A0ABV8RL98_9SPHN
MLIATSLAMLLAAGVAAEPPAPAVQPAPKEADPLICERQLEPGSLLKKKKVCKRKSEWAEQRRDNRMLIERSQTQRTMSGQ